MAVNVVSRNKCKALQKSRDRIKKPKQKYVCYICGQTYSSETRLDIHIGIHNGTSPFECEYCGKQFTQKVGLKKHLPIHTQIPQYQVIHCISTRLISTLYSSFTNLYIFSVRNMRRMFHTRQNI